MKLRPHLFLALGAGMSLATAACSDKAADNTATTDTAAMATATGAATPAAADSHAAQFLTDAIQASNAEIKAGQAAVDMGSSQGVKDYGQMLIDDHTKANEQAKQLAMTMNVPVPTGTTPEADSELSMMTSMSGAGFDKDFLSAMIKDHQKAIDMFQQEADSSDPATVTDFAKQTLPTLKKHLETAQSLSK
jgi:putative membrane protein